MDKEILQCNRLIAEFMGATPYRKNYFRNVEPFTSHRMHIDSLEYHSSWEWLMPVVERIEAIPLKKVLGGGLAISFKYGVGIRINTCIFVPDNGLTSYPEFYSYSPSNIEATYKAVVQFITWYNQQNKTA